MYVVETSPPVIMVPPVGLEPTLRGFYSPLPLPVGYRGDAAVAP